MPGRQFRQRGETLMGIFYFTGHKGSSPGHEVMIAALYMNKVPGYFLLEGFFLFFLFFFRSIVISKYNIIAGDE